MRKKATFDLVTRRFKSYIRTFIRIEFVTQREVIDIASLGLHSYTAGEVTGTKGFASANPYFRQKGLAHMCSRAPLDSELMSQLERSSVGRTRN